MGFTKVKPDPEIREKFRRYCIRHGYNAENCIRPEADSAYDELFDTFRERVKHKPDSYDAYSFAYQAGYELEMRANEICHLTWGPYGYKEFLVFHPTRTISAPMYGDRVVEKWYTDKYIAPYFQKRLSEKNLACQKGKGPHELILNLEDSLHNIWEQHGEDFWFLKTDFEGYYDNLSHEWIKKCFEGIDPYAYFLFSRTIDSWEETEEDSGKFYQEGKEEGKRYGVPKGNLPSQWAGIVNLNGLDHEMQDLPGYIDGYRYMDDGLYFFKTKEDARNGQRHIEQYLHLNKVGVRLHARKTHYAPIKQGFNFCGWHIKLRENDGSVELKIRQDRKKLKKIQLKGMQKAYRKGHIPFERAKESMTSVFAHYHTGDTKRLRKYMVNRYLFTKEEDGKILKNHLRDLKRKTRTEKRREEQNKAFLQKPKRQ